MEIALQADIPTYVGGVGVLAGITLRSASDGGLPAVGITVLHRKGYFDKHLDKQGNQSETNSLWRPEAVLEANEVRASIVNEGRPVRVRAWQYSVQGFAGYVVPAYLLAIALNGSFFNTQRMLAQYVMNAYSAGNHAPSVQPMPEERRRPS